LLCLRARRDTQWYLALPLLVLPWLWRPAVGVTLTAVTLVGCVVASGVIVDRNRLNFQTVVVNGRDYGNYQVGAE
jgi:hypothetical protein